MFRVWVKAQSLGQSSECGPHDKILIKIESLGHAFEVGRGVELDLTGLVRTVAQLHGKYLIRIRTPAWALRLARVFPFAFGCPDAAVALGAAFAFEAAFALAAARVVIMFKSTSSLNPRARSISRARFFLLS